MITVEQKEIELDDRILTELENHHKNAKSIFNLDNEHRLSCFDIIFVKDMYDVLKAATLFKRVNISLFSSDATRDSFMLANDNNPLSNNFLIKSRNHWRIQSHYIWYGMSVESLEKCVDYITSSKSYIDNVKDYTRERLKSRISELKKGKSEYNDIAKSSSPGYIKPTYSKEAQAFWNVSDLIIKELEALL
jgi:hypothetical protein